MVFSPADLVTMTCRDVDLNFAIRDSFTDTAISSSRVNGEHREKVLQRWDAGDSNGESYDLESDASNGWDANEMFKSHEETYGVKSTYDSSLSMYTVPLERGTSDMFRQREARAARLATEIESSPQYRRRVSLENTDGKTEEEKYSAVLRGDKEDQRGSSPGFSSSGREGKYIPLPQRAREMGTSSAGGGGRGTLGGSGRLGGGPASSSRYAPPPGSSPSSSSSRYAPPPGSSPSSSSSSDRSSPLSVRTAYSPHQQGSPAAGGSPTPSSSSSSHLPHSLSHPQALSDAAAARSAVNGVVSRTSPKSQRPQSNRTLRTPNSQSSPAVSRSPKPDNAPAQDLPLAGPAYLDSSPSSVTTATSKPCGPTPLFPVDVNEILISAAKERMEGLASPQEGKNSKTPSVQQRTQLEELRKFGKEFRLQPSSSSSSSANLASLESSSPAGVAPQMVDSRPAQEQQIPEAVSCSTATLTPPTPTPGVPQSAGPDRQSAGTPQPSSGTLATMDSRPDSVERTNNSPVAVVQVKNSTLNPNAKEFLPIKAPTVLKPPPTPTPPRPTPPSPSLVLPPPLPGPPQGGGQPGGGPGAIYSSPPGPYLSYVFPNSIHGHPVQAVSQAPQMYQYMSTVAQSKYPRAKGPVVGPRAVDHHASQTQANMMQAAASAAGAPLVASPYQSYLQYGQVLQAMPPHYHGQPMYSMLQGGARMLTSPQGMGHPGPQYPGQTEGPQVPQQAMYAPQAFSHHTGGSMHHPQPSSTPTGSQPQPQHTAPSPGHAQSGQGGPQPQSIYHSSTPPSLPPGHSSPQASYPMQSYSLQTHQHMAHGFPTISQLTQAHVAGGMSGPHHHSAGPPPPQVMLHYAAAPQQGGANAPQHGPPPQQGTHQHYYIGHPQALQVQAHPSQQLSFHPAGN